MKTNEILYIRIRPNALKLFAEWQESLHAAISSAQGFISIEILSAKTSKKPQWTIIQRFSSPSDLALWRNSKSYHCLHQSLGSLCIECKKEFDSSLTYENGVTEVFVTKVSPEQIDHFQNWLGKIHKAEATFAGFQRVYIQAPKDTTQNTWITLLQFDTQENLDCWLNSDIRKNILQEAESLVTSLESHRVVSPFGGWFGGQMQDEALSVVKQTMLVLLVLFPIVMLEVIYLSPLTAGFNSSLAMFIANTISVSLISWPFLPLCISYLNWWLNPKNTRANVLGTLLVLALYAIEIAIFW